MEIIRKNDWRFDIVLDGHLKGTLEKFAFPKWVFVFPNILEPGNLTESNLKEIAFKLESLNS